MIMLLPMRDLTRAALLLIMIVLSVLMMTVVTVLLLPVVIAIRLLMTEERASTGVVYHRVRLLPGPGKDK